MTEDERKIFIGELSEIVNRRVNTIRGWERSGSLPEDLRPARASGCGWRYWTPEQVSGISRWMVANRRFPGAGLANFYPSAAHVEKVLERLRKSRA